MAVWADVGSVMGAVSTAVMAVYTIRLYRLNDGLSQVNKTLIKEGKRQQAYRQNTVRMTTYYRLLLARNALEEGINHPTFLITWAQRTLDWRNPPADDLFGVFTEEQTDAVIRAFLAMESFTNDILMLTWTHKQSSGPLGWVVPVLSNRTIQQQAYKLAKEVLLVVIEAQTVCGFVKGDATEAPVDLVP